MTPSLSSVSVSNASASPFAGAREVQSDSAFAGFSAATVVEIGTEAKSRAQGEAPSGPVEKPRSDDAPDAQAGASKPGELTESEQKQVKELKARDREVRVHEQAHKSAGGQYAGPIHLDLERGPDGGSYAVSGHVNIDVSPVQGDPAATIRKMAIVARSANAPAEPSSADRAVAAKAASEGAKARAELAAERLKPQEDAPGIRPGAAPDEAHGVGHPAEASESQYHAVRHAQDAPRHKPLNLVA